MDAIASQKTTAGPPANSKLTKGKLLTGTSNLPQILYGCEHLEPLFAERRKVLVQQYTNIVQTIHDRHNIIAQTHRSSLNGDSKPVLSVTPTYMCLQCVGVFTPELRDEHFEAKKHAFSVESKTGCVFCQQCKDFIYDPNLENVRLLHGRKKRKIEDTMTGEDHRLVAQNSTFAPCRAIGLRGLYNMGQTCFMSVIIQCLIHNPYIKAFYLGEGHTSKDCDKEACTSCALDEIFTEYYSVEKTEGYGAVSMLLGSWMGAQALAGYQQQDAHEYMQFILNNLHLEDGGSDTISPTTSKDGGSNDCPCFVHKIFSGKLQSTVTCDKCRNTTTAMDPVMDISLDIRAQSKKRKLSNDADGHDKNAGLELKDCLERFTAKEKLAAAEYTCEKCGGQQNATKQLSIKRLPPVLPIHLKRFETHKSSSSKLETRISFPLAIDLYPYTTRGKAATTTAPTTKGQAHPSKPAPTSASASDPTPTCIYDLSSVIVHKGKIDSGHYVSYSRKGSEWFLFDDSKVVLATEKDVLKAEAYLLMYMARCADA